MKARQISEVYDVDSDVDDNSGYNLNFHNETTILNPKHTEPLAANAVQIEQSPYLDIFHGHYTVKSNWKHDANIKRTQFRRQSN